MATATLTTVAKLVARQAEEESLTTTVPLLGTEGHCDGGNEYDGRLGVRISAIFVILFGSVLGAWFPVFAKRRQGLKVPETAFFIAKYFGSGVIIATAFIHLLAPAVDALTDPCLTGPITSYDWAEGIALMTVFVLFFAELMTMRYGDFGGAHDHDPTTAHAHISTGTHACAPGKEDIIEDDKAGSGAAAAAADLQAVSRASHAPGADHFGHNREHHDHNEPNHPTSSSTAAAGGHDVPDWQLVDREKGLVPESYAAQMTAIFILEFGVVFHSIFIGLTLAVSGAEFDTLYVVLVFHQTFEGLGLGTRLAAAPWPRRRSWTPYVMAVGYGLSTPLAIAVGLGVRTSYLPGSQTALIVNGVFDSISAGILIYTGLVELMAHEFMFSPSMQRASIRTLLSAFALMCLGAGLMALLGKWA